MQNARLAATDETNSIRLNQFKEEYDKLSEKHRHLEKIFGEKELEVEKLSREMKKVNANEIEEAKNEIMGLKSNM